MYNFIGGCSAYMRSIWKKNICIYVFFNIGWIAQLENLELNWKEVL